MAVKKKTTENQTQELHVRLQGMGKVHARIIGTSPMFQNRMSNKAKQQLLIGGRKKGAADRAKIKHDPLAEFRDSAEIVKDGPTALGLRVTAIKAAMCTAAIDTEGLSKAQTQRLIFMPGDHVPLYGIPQLRMDVVRSADMNRTPDVRSRVFLPKWCAEVDIDFAHPQFGVNAIANLLGNAGVLVGLGDFRQEKGKGAFGAFRVIVGDEQDDEWDDLTQNHGRAAQLAALEDPEYATEDTVELMQYFGAETLRRAA